MVLFGDNTSLYSSTTSCAALANGFVKTSAIVSSDVKACTALASIASNKRSNKSDHGLSRSTAKMMMFESR